MENSDKDLKNVVWVVFMPSKLRNNASIYLIDLAKGKLRGFVHLDTLDYPDGMEFASHKSMLYMFGGNKESDSSRMGGSSDLYELDLLELSKTGYNKDNKVKPLPKKIASMNSGKGVPMAAVMGDKIFVLDTVLGHKPPNCNFEYFDPVKKTWHKIPDPFPFKPGHFVGNFCVKDNKLFISFRGGCGGIFELTLGSSPVWRHHDVLYGVKRVPFSPDIEMGTLQMSLGRAYDLADEKGFAKRIRVQEFGDTAEKCYEVCCKLSGGMIKIGDDKVCCIRPKLLQRRERKHYSPSNGSSSTLQPVVCKRRRRRGGYRFVVNVCCVDATVRPICLNVLRSFTVPMDYKEGEREESGCFGGGSLCHPV